jgi:membrane-associated protease RseP (regulator of RpoE activity)
MRLWPFGRRRRARPHPAPEDLFVTEDLLHKHLEDLMVVRDRHLQGGVIVFRGELLSEPPRALEALMQRFRPLGYTPFIRRDGDVVSVQAWPFVDTAAPSRIGLNVALFALTCLSTLVAGWLFYFGSPTFDALRASPSWWRVLAGVPFAATLLSILATHEFGHYFAARYYRASVSLPYFIPAPPPVIFGTLGAIIRMRSPVRDRNSLFDIAAAGPLAGLLVAVPAFVIGLSWSKLAPAHLFGPLAFGESLLMRFFIYLRFGEVPDGMMVFTHPVADAAWAGFLVTALNLFPAGQLDGGRIAYALFGRYHLLVGRATFVGLLVMAAVTWSPNWLVWAALIFFVVGFHHAPPLDDVTPLSPGRRVVGFVCLALLVLLMPPMPFQ